MNRKFGADKYPVANLGKRSLIIAEIGLNFDGDQALAVETIEAASACGVDAVKFQVYRTDEFVFDRSSTYTYSLASGETVCESEYEMFKRHELSLDSCRVLKTAAERVGLTFFSSVADESSCEQMAELGVDIYKIASVDLPNTLLLKSVGEKKGRVILSTGMADEREIDIAVSTLVAAGASDVSLMHCVSVYPTPIEVVNIQRISELKKAFGLSVGFSDHSEGFVGAIVAVGLGCALFEKHFTLDQNRRGPDHRFSADPQQMSDYANTIRTAELARGSGGLSFSKLERESREKFRCSIHARADIEAGTEIDSSMLAFYRPGTGLQPYEIDRVVGRRAKKRLHQGEMINLNDLV